jgi:EAL domain-containing protein (putative c-di-GMP-specific phosphodiesterase class I)/GGDEF domain-containing protein
VFLQSSQFSKIDAKHTSAFVDSLQSIISANNLVHHESTLMLIRLDNTTGLDIVYPPALIERILGELESELKAMLHNKYLVTRLDDIYIGVILEDCNEESAELYAKKIHDFIQLFRHSESSHYPIHVVSKIVSVMLPGDAKNAGEALHKAYAAINHMQDASCGIYYKQYNEMATELVSDKERFVSADKLKKAIVDNRLRLAFQPIIDSVTGHVEHYECLLRILDEDNNIISAGPYIGIAEQYGFINLIDELVFDMVIDELNNSSDIKLAFNLSALGIDNKVWLNKAKKALQDPAIAERLLVEITETASQNDLGKTAYFVAALQDMGCKVALDDFGAGHTSFRQLRTLSVDLIKIDGAFIRDIVTNRDSLLFVKSLLSLSRGYGFKAVAEFVENAEIAKLLIELQVDYMQGNYFCPAINYRSW